MPTLVHRFILRYCSFSVQHWPILLMFWLVKLFFANNLASYLCRIITFLSSDHDTSPQKKLNLGENAECSILIHYPFPPNVCSSSFPTTQRLIVFIVTAFLWCNVELQLGVITPSKLSTPIMHLSMDLYTVQIDT